MATKRKLSDLVRQEFRAGESSSQTSKVTDSATVSPADPSSSSHPESTSSVALDEPNFRLTESVANEASEPVSDKVPKYLTLDRKEVRFRPDQVDGLNQLTKALNRKRRGQGERITDNTLIRVAVDLLLHQIDKIQGTTEAEIRGSIGLSSATYRLPELQTL